MIASQFVGVGSDAALALDDVALAGRRLLLLAPLARLLAGLAGRPHRKPLEDAFHQLLTYISVRTSEYTYIMCV